MKHNQILRIIKYFLKKYNKKQIDSLISKDNIYLNFEEYLYFTNRINNKLKHGNRKFAHYSNKNV